MQLDHFTSRTSSPRSGLIHIFVNRLSAWHNLSQHKYPFRNVRDPYRVLIAEMMLRQTTAAQVSRVYPRFVKKYPNIQVLAKADPRQVRALIKPLGLRSRCSNLLEMSKIIQACFEGEIPSSVEALVALPGVGEYIANSVLVRAYGQRLPLVDSNVNRVLSRIFTAKEKLAAKVAEAAFMNLSRYANPEKLNYAIIDLAHSICTYSKPRCPVCPIRRSCLYAKSVANLLVQPSQPTVSRRAVVALHHLAEPMQIFYHRQNGSRLETSGFSLPPRF